MTILSFARNALLAACASVAASASAATFSYDYANEFSGGTPPSGPSPWASLSFSDVVGGVEMSLSLNSWTGFVPFFGINYGSNPGSNAALAPLGFTFLSGQVASSINKSADAYRADGDGSFDIRFNFPSANNGNRLTGGETVKYLITGVGGGGASLFNNTSLTGGGNGIWYSTLHVQGLANGESGWLGATPAVPEPESYLLMLAGLGLIATLARRRHPTAAA